MIEKRISLRTMYDELMDICLKPDEKMLKVGTEYMPGIFFLSSEDLDFPYLFDIKDGCLHLLHLW